MQTRLFVGNLNFKVTEEELKQFFSKAGQVESVSIIRNRRSGRPKGYGFVQMVDLESAQNAIMYNGAELLGRPLIVAESNPKRSGFERGFGRRSRFGGRGRRDSRNNRYDRTSSRKESLWSKLTGWVGSLFGR